MRANMQDLLVTGQESMKPVAKKWQNRNKKITFLAHCWAITKNFVVNYKQPVLALGKI
tara:strand:+ start:5699 stop:5872 length:174 start_codon:yes stop_codon:yes gene_type:complete